MEKLSEYPLSRLQDKLDFKQALYELWTEHDPSYLEELSGVLTKREQKRALHYYLYERNFPCGKDFSGLIAMLRYYFEEHSKDKRSLERIFSRISEHYLTLKRSPITKNGIKMTLKSLLNYKVLVSGNWKDGKYENRTSELAGYILAFHPEFPEDFPEAAENKESSAIHLGSFWDLAFAIYDLFAESVSWDIPWEERWDTSKGREDFVKEQLTLKNEGRFYFREPNEPFDMSKAFPSAGWQDWRLGEGYERHDRVIQEWVTDFLSRLKSTIDQNLLSTIEKLATIDTTGHPDRWPGRESRLQYRKWRFYAALFERLLLNTPEWLNLRFLAMPKNTDILESPASKPVVALPKIVEAFQLPVTTIKTDVDLERAVFGLYLQYSEAGKDLFQHLKTQHYQLAIESDEQELQADEQFDVILTETLEQNRPETLKKSVNPANIEWCAGIIRELQHRSINADGLTLSELTGCRWQECEEEKVKDLFSWVVQHPHCMSEFYENLPTPVRLLDKPMTELKDTLDWRQAFYELAFGCDWPSGKEVLGTLLEFPINQSKTQQEEKLNRVENGYLENRTKELELRKGLNSEKIEAWIENFRHTLAMAFERKNTSSLKIIFQKNALPVFYLAGDLWRSIIDKPLPFFTDLPEKLPLSNEIEFLNSSKLLLLQELCNQETIIQEDSPEESVSHGIDNIELHPAEKNLMQVFLRNPDCNFTILEAMIKAERKKETLQKTTAAFQASRKRIKAAYDVEFYPIECLKEKNKEGKHQYRLHPDFKKLNDLKTLSVAG